MQIYIIIILIFSVILHEISHGYAAEFLGDPTPRLQGRLTLNPIKHLDLIGSVIVPLLLIVSGSGIIFGWAKPVQFNPYYFKNKRWGNLIVAIAGPLSNIFLFLFFGLILRFSGDLLSPTTLSIISSVVIINIVLAVFNLIPIPPLDGHHILFSILPESMNKIKKSLRKYSLPFFLFFIFFLWKYITPLIFDIYDLII